MGNTKANVDGLDLIKAVSITLIVFHHYQQSFSSTFNGVNFYGGSFYFGFIVELFFMISGFVAVYSYSPDARWGGTETLH